MAKADASGCQAQRLNLLQGRERVRQAAVSHGLRWLMEDWLAERRRQRHVILLQANQRLRDDAEFYRDVQTSFGNAVQDETKNDR